MKPLRRIAAIICIVASFAAHAGEQFTGNSEYAANLPPAVELQPLQGAWEGFMLGDPSYQKVTVTIVGDSLRFHRDTDFWFATAFTLPVGTDPKQLRATIKDSAPGQENSVGQVVAAMYKIEDGNLTLVPLGGEDEETPESFEAAADKGLARYELRKIRPQKENTEPSKTE